MPNKYKPPKNDHLSANFDAAKLIPKEYAGTDRFLDILTWNVRYFNDQDPNRVANIARVLAALNADIIVLQEVMDGSLGKVADTLRKRGSGAYKTAYGTTGGDQRVAIMYDIEWIRAKDDVCELFEKGKVRVDGKEVFPRLPLRGYFTGLSYAEENPFDFQLVGLHLKSQRGGGGEQRKRAAEALSRWLEEEAPLVDPDVIMLGDWNESPDKVETWKPLLDLEKREKALFSKINKSNEISHLMFQSKQKVGSRLDLTCVSIAAASEMKGDPQVVRWKGLDEFLSPQRKAKDIKASIKAISENLADHMPVVARFYFTEQKTRP